MVGLPLPVPKTPEDHEVAALEAFEMGLGPRHSVCRAVVEAGGPVQAVGVVAFVVALVDEIVDLLVPVPKSHEAPPVKLEMFEIRLALVDSVRQIIVEAGHSVRAVAAVALVETVVARGKFVVVESDGLVQAVVAKREFVVVESDGLAQGVVVVALVGETVVAMREFEVVESDGSVQAVVAAAPVGMVVENHQSGVAQRRPAGVAGEAFRAVASVEPAIGPEAFRLGLHFDFVGSRANLADLVVEVLDAEMAGSDSVVLGTVDDSVPGWVDLGFRRIAEKALEAVVFAE